MVIIKKKNEYEFLLYLSVKPNSREQSIELSDDSIIVHVQSKPVQNRANKEIINILRKKLRISTDQIKFLSGLTKNDKIINLIFREKMSEQEVIKKLSE
jgi:uncharacterized protein YggU (UPF0235/DUF167 family)